MATNIFLGYPPENIKRFIIENYGPKEEDYDGPLCFTANEPGSIVELLHSKYDPEAGYIITKNITAHLQYSINNMKTWTIWDGSRVQLDDCENKKMYLRADPENPNTSMGSNSTFHNFNLIGSIAVSGNIQYLLTSDGSMTQVSEYCYYNMFQGCKSLTQAPKLTATTLASSCYEGMFNGCTSLTKAPELPAETLAPRCYNGMFQRCTSLTKAPSILPATTLFDFCYNDMFEKCSSLIQAPIIPITTTYGRYDDLDGSFIGTYNFMFQGCKSLTDAYFPNLQSEIVMNNIVQQNFMFYDAASNITIHCSDKTIIIN